MLLAVDVGNTHTVLGLFREDQLIADWRMASLAYRTADEEWLAVRHFCEVAGTSAEEITGVGISSVVPDLTGVLETMTRKYVRTAPVTISAELDVGMPILYHDARAVGADRLCNAVAGFAHYGGPLIIIDFGTATTYDVVSGKGEYIGGVITLGLESSALELHRRTAKLPKIDLTFPPSIIGRDTVSSMQAGAMFGTVESVEGIVRRIRQELGSPATVIATGGLAPVIAKHTTVIAAVEPSLVLNGVRIIYERTRR